MAIHQPGRRLLHAVPLKFVYNRVAGGGRKSVDVSITLIPFIDFLIVLVVFLLMSFSASGELLAQQKDLVMPNAVNAGELEIAPIIAISPSVISLDGRRVADTQTLAQNPAGDERIERLIQDLETLKRNWSILHPSESFPAAVILQADQGTDFRVIKKVMASTAQAGYSNVSFAVNKSGD